MLLNKKYFDVLKTKRSKAKSKRTEQLVPLKCRNCDAPMNGPYCHVCGQHLFAGKEGFFENFLNNTLSLYAVDFKIFRTLWLLLFCPGELTKEYCRGRIIRYEHPFKLFWFVAVFFFVYFAYKFDPNSTKLIGDVELNKKMMAYLPYATLLLIPFFSLLLFVFFKKNEPRYGTHTIFALHYHTFLYVFFAVLLFFSTVGVAINGWLLFLIPYLYLMVAVYRFYKPNMLFAFLKVLLILVIHLMAIGILLLLLLVLLRLVFR